MGGFPVNFPECVTNDQSDSNTWKNLVDVFMTPSGSGNLLGAQPAGSLKM